MKLFTSALAICALSLLALPQSASAIELCVNGICINQKGKVHERESWEDRYRSWDEYCYFNPQDYNCEEEGYFDAPGFRGRHWHHRDHRDFYPTPAPFAPGPWHEHHHHHH